MSYIFLSVLMIMPLYGLAQQQPDTSFTVNIDEPRYVADEGPVICFDSAHNNFHTLMGGFAPTAYILRKDGYQTIDFPEPAEQIAQLNDCRIFVTVNPLHESNLGNWQLPNPPVYSAKEVETIKNWVAEGGSLFLIADHMPFPGAASNLTKAFGFEFSNGFARLNKEGNSPDVFSMENGKLSSTEITDGITRVTSFTGSAFTYPSDATPVMLFEEGDVSLEPEIAWQFTDTTKTIDLNGFSQGVIMEFGKGRLAVFGEAAMFTAQKITNDQGEFKFGLNNRNLAPQNIQFLLNLIHWLDEGR
ncbi:MAG: hypothetical protein JJ953_10710 [Gracilimonas sp.]|uniref:hypothetical protein n=1 Tax=Gracilimonas TaxID=649462 RepID=UPI001B0434CA|nr:hypothetical protein [Gracilimonas sp.]MBO6586566.1 hypothetical protein [Gracilimonas sp.]MBO6615223.1 hypothetical protein [Gracilimonas sp.]